MLCNQKYYLDENRACFSNCNYENYYQNNLKKISSSNIQYKTTTMFPLTKNYKLFHETPKILTENNLFFNLSTKTEVSLVKLLTSTVSSIPFANKCFTIIPPPSNHHRHRLHFSQNKSG